MVAVRVFILTFTEPAMSALRCRFCGIVAICLISCAPAWGQAKTGDKPAAKPAARPQAAPPNVVIERNIEYGKAGDLPLLLDIARPKEPSAKPLPVIAFIHGGGWRGGEKSGALGSVIPFVATGNYFGVSIEYRFSNVAIWPAQIHDCKAAIRWIRANAKKYNLDTEKIGVWGGSAGGHLVSMLGVSGGVKELDGCCGSPGLSSRVACVVDFCGPSDFPAIAALKNANGRGAYGPCCGLIGGPIEEKKEQAKSVSPVTYVAKDAAPFLIVHGTQDNTVPIQQAETLHAALQKVGVPSTLVKIEGGGHGIGGPEVQQRVQAFFEKHLRGQAVEVSDAPIVQRPAPKK